MFTIFSYFAFVGAFFAFTVIMYLGLSKIKLI
nr:subunit VI of cytochrome b6/f complex [Streptofilum capillatum]WKT08598.1 subunit VI of cytochrome b6/f complex [Streptofilum capillatum]WKT08697.1 subunit VI of cytochrome b6/f complex [Streptofilum sp. BC4-VF8pt]WKT08796.1 subunit VI of cytochrome b6/f complex [Streptofilum sp. ZNP2-VF4pt]